MGRARHGRGIRGRAGLNKGRERRAQSVHAAHWSHGSTGVATAVRGLRLTDPAHGAAVVPDDRSRRACLPSIANPRAVVPRDRTRASSAWSVCLPHDSPTFDELAGGTDHSPDSAVLGHALTEDLTRSAVADVEDEAAAVEQDSSERRRLDRHGGASSSRGDGRGAHCCKHDQRRDQSNAHDVQSAREPECYGGSIPRRSASHEACARRSRS
jgi:hypothetical protein